MVNRKPVATPMEEPKSRNDRLEVITKQEDDAVGVPYREDIGSMMYLVNGLRLDIAFAVGKLAQFCENAKSKHWVAVKRVFRYTNGTSKMDLCYDGLMIGKLEGNEKIDRNGIFGYTDSDWAGDVADRKSTSGYVFMMAGSGIKWCSKKQTAVALSSCEAEYIAMCMASKEAIWLTRLLTKTETNTDRLKGMIVLADSQSGMKLPANVSINSRNKHIDINYHFVRHVTEDGRVILLYVPKEFMVGDMLNKALGRIKLEKLRHLCGMRIKGEN